MPSESQGANHKRVTSHAREVFSRIQIPVFILIAGTLIAVYFQQSEDPANAFLGMSSAVAGSILTFFAWLAFGSGWQSKWRHVPLCVTVILLAATAACFRIESVTGGMRPTLAFRWSPKPDELLDRVNTKSTAPRSEADLNRTSATDYPRFLGPEGRPEVFGVHLETNWAENPPELLWKQPIGAGWSSFAIVGEYAVTQEQRGDRELAVCYELRTGKPVWSHAEDVRHESILGGVGPRATPAIHEGNVYTLGATGLFNCLDGKNGSQLWETKDLLAEHGAVNVAWGKSCSPLIVDDKVVVSAGGPDGHSLVAYHKDSGDLVWTGGDRQSSYASPILTTLAGIRQIVMVNQDYVTAHAPDSGDVLWEHPWPGNSNSNATASQPVPVDENRLFISKGYGHGSALWEVTAGDSGELSIQEIWTSNLPKTKFTNVVIHGGHVYGLDEGILCCVELATGKRKWKKGRYLHGQIMLIDDVILVVSEWGELFLVEANANEHRELSSFPAVEGKMWANPALSGQNLLVRSDKEVACYRLPVKQ